MSEIAIDAGIPVPPPSNGGRAPKYPFAAMNVGDSFAIPLTGLMHEKGGDLAYNRLKGASVRWKNKHGGEYRIRTRREEGVVRCWRVS